MISIALRRQQILPETKVEVVGSGVVAGCPIVQKDVVIRYIA